MMHHVKLVTVLGSGDRVEHFYWANGGARQVQTRTAYYGPAFGPDAHWSEVDSFTPDRDVSVFFAGLRRMRGASVASVR